MTIATKLQRSLVALTLAAPWVVACGGDDDDNDNNVNPSDISFDETGERTIEAGDTVEYTISGLDDDQAYRITLVVADNLTPAGSGMGTFVDADANGAADAGASEDVALITVVDGDTVDGGAKTVPGGDDDPMAPSGVFPSSGEITLTVSGVGAGTVYPVAYENGGASTFLEIDGSGSPIETYAVGGAVTVTASEADIMVAPATATEVEVGGTVDYTISGLDDDQAYRVTLVVSNNVTTSGDGVGVFIDDDANGAADAGASETIALITDVNGGAVTGGGAKTVPGGDDDPMAPSGIFPSSGEITLTVATIGVGTVYPVVYENGGESTFLEIDDTGAPVEPYRVGGAVSVQRPEIDILPATSSSVAAAGTVAYTVSGLSDAQAYRITLVVDGNVTAPGDGTGTFVDGDANGAADAGASENIALLTMVNGMAVANGGAKTVPGGGDDPMAPSGVFPTAGTITFLVTGVAAGTVHPVIYENGGASTFLEVDDDGAPIEVYRVAASVTVQ